MRSRTAARLAWALWIVTLIAATASLVLIYLSRSAHVSDVIGFRGFDAVLAIVFATVGAVVAARRPSNPVGWLLLVFGGGNAPVSLLQQYAFFALVGRPDHLWGGAVAAWAQEVLGVSQGPIFILLLLLFPTGRLLSRRWRLVGVLAVAGGLGETLGSALLPGPIATFRTLENPFGVTGASASMIRIVDAVGNGLFLLTLLAGVLAIVLRFRRAERIERQQLKWIAASVALVGVGWIGFMLTGQEAGTSPAARPLQIFLILAICAVPIAAGFAILRYRLYDIDRIISRTLSYGLVTAFLGGMFALVVLVPTAVIGSGTRTPDWLIAVGTLAVVALFRPVRRRVQGAVDHRFNRARYNAEQTIESFTAHLRDEVDLATLQTELTDVVNRTMRPAHVSLWLRPEVEQR